ncbi:hypothetical protein [Actinomadura oligospora]|uniref:hypothetical protein n=1 Tax=Actinomadura oligospora TaxID=111804 RepID=UPI000479ED0C|nr:hypothetical protein [Actinomadura oligospora]
MAILDRANEEVLAYPIRYEGDGYGGKTPTHLGEDGKPLTPVRFRAYVLPVGYSGAGWAVDIRTEAQGWADVQRVRVICKPVDGAPPTGKWGRIEFRNQAWTVQEEPKLFRGSRTSQSYVSLLVELLGDA